MPESQEQKKLEVKDELVQILISNVNLKGIAFDLIDGVAEEALRNIVESSENKWDDALMTSIYPVLEKELKRLIEEKLKELLK